MSSSDLTQPRHPRESGDPALSFSAAPEELTAAHRAIFAGLESGDLKPIVGRQIPLERAFEAHEQVLEPGAHGKIVLTI